MTWYYFLLESLECQLGWGQIWGFKPIFKWRQRHCIYELYLCRWSKISQRFDFNEAVWSNTTLNDVSLLGRVRSNPAALCVWTLPVEMRGHWGPLRAHKHWKERLERIDIWARLQHQTRAWKEEEFIFSRDPLIVRTWMGGLAWCR